MNKKIKSPDNHTEILIVEDSPTQVARIKYFLEKNNYKTEDCKDGNQALLWLSDHKPSLIISDVLMPGMNGFELCEKIKSDNRTKDIPVILLTTLTDTDEVIKGLIAGADSFLTKPYNDGHLLLSIQKILEDTAKGEPREEESDLEIFYQGKKRIIRTGPQKVIKLLLNNYQGAIYQNELLRQTQEELRLLNEQLETIVLERTSDLAKEIRLNSNVTEQLRESEEKYRSIVETANEGIWKIDADLITTFVNEKMADMLGYTSQEMTGRSAMDFMDEAGKVGIRKNYVHRRQNLKESFEQEFIRKDGTRIITAVNISPFQNSIGEFSGSLGLLTDITERKKVENALKESREKLLQSNKELESFARIASHDLQEPLRMVSSFTQLLEQQYGDKLDDRAREYIQFAVEGAHRMYNLLNGLLSYSRIQRKRNEYTAVDLNHVLENVKKNLAISITKRNALISSEKLPVILADESQINQLLQNIISNGIKFSNEPPRIYVSSKTERDKYIVSVRDEGIGIEPQYYGKIFQIFQQLHARNEYEGTGIGLSICKSIVERHEGHIWVESEPGKGSTFFFSLPRKKSTKE
jgi:PAS domain S-box-containing protein